MLLSHVSKSQVWGSSSGVPAGLAQHTAVVGANGLVYVFGGWDGSTLSDSLYIFNPSTNSWATGANYPTSSRGLTSALGSDGLIYGFSGFDGSVTTSCHRYDPGADTWTAIANIPSGVWQSDAVAYGNKIYVSGGEGATGSLQIYDIPSNSWSSGASLPGSGTHQHESVAFGGNIYLVAGADGGSYGSTKLPVYIYDTAANSWSTGASMDTGRFQPGAVVNTAGEIYVFGGSSSGINEGGTYYSSVEIYDIANDTWSIGTPMPTAAGETQAVLVDGEVYVIGGYNGSNYATTVASSPIDPQNALDFDGTDDHVEIPHNSALNLSSAWSMEAWIRPDTNNSAWQAIISKGVSPRAASIWQYQNKLQVWFDPIGLVIESSASLTLGEWVHVAATYSSNTLRLYINGQLDSSTVTASNPDVNTSSSMYFGQRGDNNLFFNGRLDEVRIWSTERTAAEVQTFYQCEVSSSFTDLIAYYSFNNPDAGSNETNTNDTVLADTSGNGHDGVLRNFALADSSSNWVDQADSISGNCDPNADVDPPVVLPFSSVTLQLDGTGSATLTTAAADSATNDAGSGINSLSLSQTIFGCGDIGTQTVTLYAVDNLGYSDSATFNVVVVDTGTINATAVVDSTLDCFGDSDAQVSVSATGGTPTYTYLWNTTETNQAETALAAGTYSVTVTDANGCTDSTSITVTEPSALALSMSSTQVICYQDGSATASVSGGTTGYTYLWSNGATSALNFGIEAGTYTVTIDDANSCGTLTDSVTVTNGSTVPIVSITSNTSTCPGLTTGSLTATGTSGFGTPYTFAWSNATNEISSSTSTISGLAAGTYTISLTDNAGCGPFLASATVATASNPVASASETTAITCNGAMDGQATASATSGTTPYTYSWNTSETNALETNLDAGTYSVTITDQNGCTDSASVTLSEPAVLIATAMVDSNASCNGFADGGATVSETGGTSGYDYIWSNGDTTAAVSGLAAGPYSVTVTDANGCTDSASVTITEPDVLVASINLDSNVSCVGFSDGGATAMQTGGTSTYSYSWSNSVVADHITGVAIGTYSVTITDANSCTDSASITIVVGDNTSPTAVAVDTTIYLDGSGAASVTSAEIGYGSSDNCSINSLSLDDSTFNCSDTGANTVTLTVIDNNGNSSNTTATVTVLDTTSPSAVAIDTTIYLDASGEASLTAAQIGYGSTDNCSIASLSIGQTAFDCTNVGTVPVLLTVLDPSGNQDTMTSTVTVLDTVSPVAMANDTTIYLDGSGTISVTAAEIDDGSYDSCGIASLSLDSTTFDCSETGVNVVTLTVTDNNGNVNTTTANVTVEDTTAPGAMAADTTVYVDGSGNISVTAAQIGYASTDNCSIVSLSLNDSNFDCSDAGSIVNVTLTVVDASGNSSTDVSAITVNDSTSPSAVAADTTIYLDANGDVSLTAAQIGYASSDNCSVASMTIGQTDFDCSDVGSAVSVLLTVTDPSGNQDTASASVTVLDTVSPTVTTNDTTIYLNGSGTISVTAAEINDGSYDSCGIASMVLDSTDFNCSETGVNVVTLTVTDNNGNVSTGTANVTVLDTTAPAAMAVDTTLYLDGTGAASVTAAQIGYASSDNCAIVSLSLNDSTFDCSDAGSIVNVTLTVVDASGNSATDVSAVTVNDSTSPAAAAADTTIYLDANGDASLTAAQIGYASSDNCSVVSMTISQTDFDCSDVGSAVSVLLTVTDPSGNQDTASASVTVLDTISPTVITNDTTIYLNGSGTISVTAAEINDGSYDSCGIASMVLDSTDFDCSETGVNVVTLTVTDNNGNVSTGTANVTVLDTTAPAAMAADTTLYLDANGDASVTAAQIGYASSDNCAIVSLSLNDSTFDCSDAGSIVNVTLTVVDASGNSSTDVSAVTVNDSTSPAAVAADTTIYLDANGEASLTAAQIGYASSDNCSIVSLSLNDSTFDCSDAGSTLSILLTVADPSGNQDTASASVTVLDTVSPTVITNDTTIYLGGSGTISVTAAEINNGSYDSCGIASVVLDSTDFDCSETGINVVTLTVTDNNGNASTGTANVTVLDTTSPAAVAADTTIYLDANGDASVTAAQIGYGSSDNCSIVSLSLNDSTFDCSDAGSIVNITLTVVDASGNSSTDVSAVTVNDSTSPSAVAADTTIYLDANGDASLTAAQIGYASSDNCSVASMTISQTDFDCSNVGSVVSVLLTVTDPSGNQDTASASVTVLDTVSPTVITNDTTIYLNGLGSISVTASEINDGSYDSCGIASMVLDSTDFDCSETGVNVVTLTVTDNNGNVSTGTANVTVLDTTSPAAMAADTTLYLDGTGAASVTAAQLGYASDDNCSIVSLSLNDSTFDCSDAGSIVNVTLTVVDASGNSSTDVSAITVNDSTAPSAVAADTTIYLDANGDASLTAAQLGYASSDNCSVASMTISQTDFDCSDVGSAVSVLLTVTDPSGNQDTASASVAVLDTVSPTVITNDTTIYLGGSGTISVTAAEINNGSYDSCGIASMVLDSTTFDCSETGVNVVTLTVTDNNGNISTGTANITVLDTTAPAAMAVDTTLYLDGTGAASVTAAQIGYASDDNCSIVSLSLNDSTFDCSDAGSIVNVTLTVVDASGNSSTDVSAITVSDSTSPAAVAVDTTIYLDANGDAALTAAQIGYASSDNCAIVSLSLDDSTFNCSDAGSTVNVILTVVDPSGNQDTAVAAVTVLDTVSPVVVTNDTTIYLNGSGTISVTAAEINNGSYDSCGIASMVLDSTNFDCSETGVNVVTLTVTDNNGNVSTGTANVTVLDTTSPAAMAADTTIYLDANGDASVTAAQIGYASADNCSIVSLSLNDSIFDCPDAGSTVNVTLTVVDASGNSSTDVSAITVNDSTAPSAVAADTTIYLDANGDVSLTAAQLGYASSDNCSVASMTISQTDFDCSDVGSAVSVLLTVTDPSGNQDTASASVTVLNTVSPTVITNDTTIYLNGSGTISITAAEINDGSYDSCGIASMVLDSTDFDCGETGVNVVTLTVTDNNGNVSTGTANVTVVDTTSPAAVAADTTIYLDANGNAAVTAAQIGYASSDNCSIVSLSLNDSTFDCSDVGSAVNLTLTVVDASGNASTDMASITILDTIAPTTIAQDITAYLDNSGSVTITTAQIDNGSYDSCGIQSLALDTSTFDCAAIGILQTVVLTATDVNGNSSSDQAQVTVLDTTSPEAIVRNISIFLDASGMAQIAADTLDSASADNCQIDSIAISQTDFGCNEAGTIVPVTFYAFDASGNVDSAVAQVTVSDTVSPVVQTQNLTVYLDSLGAASITAVQVDNGSYDSCGVASLSLDQSSFDCSHVGNNTVTLTVTDVNGNTATDTAIITVIDTIAPTILSQDITVALDSFGAASITAAMISSGTWDSCGIASIDIDSSSFSCDAAGDTIPVVITATDVNGNVATDSALVTIIDTIAPLVVTRNLTVALDSQGLAVVDPNAVDSASTDACGIASLVLSTDSFNCGHIGAPVSITLTVTDSNGNSSSGSASITVIDTIAPEVITQDLTVYLDASGAASITTGEIDNGSSDACGIASYALDISAFNCSDAGDTVTVELTVTDVNGNQNSDTALVSVLDTLPPTVLTQNIDVYLDSLGSASITVAQVNNGSTDNCTIDTLFLDMDEFSCAEVGSNTVQLTVVDIFGNSASANATVTVFDTIAPVVLVEADTAYLDANGMLTLTAAQFDQGTWDSCGVAGTVIDTSAFDCAAADSTYTIVFTATDVNGNSASTSTTITVLDTLPPSANAQDITVYLDASGSATILPAQVDNGSADNCSIDSLALSLSSFSCSNTDTAVSVLLYVFDPSGNTDTAEAFVTVIDSIAPTVVTQNIDVYLDPFGEATLLPQMVDNGSFDVCGIDTMFVDSSNLTCANLGIPLTVTLTVVDSSGNSSSETAIINTLDTVPPEAVAQNLTVYLDSNGSATITADSVDGGTSGLCSIDSIGISISSFDCNDAGDTVSIVFSAFDQSMNQDTAHADIYVLDTIGPEVLPFASLDVYLDATGSASITPQMADSASNDACGIDSLWLDTASFGCENLGTPVIATLSARDVNGNTWSATTTVHVLDTVAPDVQVFNQVMLGLDSAGNATLTVAMVDSASSDACGIQSLVLDTSSFTCASAGDTIPVTLTATDSSGNTSSAATSVIILDTIAPAVFTQDITVALDSMGAATIVAAQIDSGSSDACGILSYALDIDNFSCLEAGTSVDVVLTVTDVNGNSASDTAMVTIIDTIAPIVLTQNITIALDASGLASITADSINNGTSDACGIASLSIDSSNFSCENLFNPVTVTLTATDSNGNVDSNTAIVTVIDDLAPQVVTQDLTVYLDSSGNASILPDSVDNGSSDNCDIESMSLDISAFSCNDIANNPVEVILTVSDTSGNSDTASSQITVLDTIAPEVITQDLTVYLDANGTASITANDVDNGSNDACGIATLSIDSSTFNCSNLDATVTVTLTATDQNGNSNSDTAIVTILDTISPQAVAQNITIQLDSFGLAVIDADSINNGSSDNCSIDSIAISVDSFTCADVSAPVQVTLTVMDQSGNSDDATAFVTVEDMIAPVVHMQNDTVYLDVNGQISIQPSNVDSGSWDSCGIASYTLDTSNFDCGNLFNPVTVTMTVMDVNGNSNSGSSTVVVEDTLAPNTIAQDLTIQLDSFGLAVITADSVDNGSDDNCSIASLTLDIDSFDCGDVGTPVTVNLVTTDQSGNTDTAQATITVEDLIAPQVITQDITVYLDASGSAIIAPDSIDNGSWDSCGIALLELDSFEYSCANLNAPLTVTLKATDVNGNSDSTTAIVTVLDTLAPTVLATPDTFYLDTNGGYTVNYQLVDAGSFDNCAIETMYLSDSTFDCTVADSTFDVWLVAIDSSGNDDSVQVALTFLDTLLPEIVCPDDILVDNDPGQCGAVVNFNLPQATDNCSIDSTVQIDTTGLVSGSTFPVGITTLTFVAYDPSGNTDTCSFSIEVQDVEDPVISCPSDTSICDSVFTFTMPTYTDNCAGFDVIQFEGIPSGNAYPVGTTINRFAVSDAYGNSDTCSFEVLRFDFPTQAVVDSNVAQCEAALAIISANSAGVGSGIWTIIEGSGTIANETDNSTTISDLPTGTTRLTWTISNGVCPTTIDTMDIDIFVSPSVANVGGTQVLCELDSTTIVADAPAIGTGSWISLSNTAIITDPNATQTTVTNLSIDDHPFVWRVDNGVCPPTFDTILVSNNPFPQIFTSEDRNVFFPTSVSIEVFYDLGATFNWEPKTDIVNDTLETAIAAPENTTTYRITVTSEAGCSSVDSTTVFVDRELEIPTAFTPNSDNFNDFWNIKELEHYPNCKVEVVDRSGNRVFYSEGYNTPWDGTNNGESLKPDSYFFIVNLGVGSIAPITGSVTIIK